MDYSRQSNLNPTVLAENSHWIVLSKPAGWLTRPAQQGSLAPAVPVLSEWAEKQFGRIWVVHRLDIETSGVVLFARTAEDHRRANLWFQKRETKKVYYCLASGRPVLPVLKLNEPIQGAPAMTQAEVVEKYGEGFFARVLIKTGRRHQIRIHLSQKGHPLLGDPTYGGLREVDLAGEVLRIDRVALHASSLSLPTGEVFEAPFPEDFSSWLDQLRKRGHRG